MNYGILVYLSSGMTNADETESRMWRKKIKQAFYSFSRSIHVFDPWDHFCFTDDNYKAKEAMDLDLWSLAKSDLMVVNIDNDPKSIGTACELAIAYTRGIPILAIHNNEYKLHDWIASMPNVFFDSGIGDDVYDEVAEYVYRHYVV